MGATWAIVVAAGRGTRFGGAKQFAPLADRRVVDWSVAAAKEVCDGVVLVRPPGAEVGNTGADAIVDGGATRSQSVRAGIAAIPAEADVIIVHDAVRPLADRVLFERVVAAIRAGADGAVPGVAVTDTIVRVEGDEPVETLDRAALVAVQTPQAFAAGALRHAHRDQPEATDDAQLVQQIGGKVVVVEGDPANLKVTQPGDLAVAATLLER